MSYILEALQKSAAERDPNVAASLVLGDGRHRKHRAVGILIAVALLANATVFAWLFWPEQAGTTQVLPPRDDANLLQSEQIPATNTIDPATSETATSGVPAAEPSTSEVTLAPALPPATPRELESLGATAPAPNPPAPVRPIVPGDLPASARNAFPDIEFSTHVYAEDPTLRAVVVNGRRLTEGDRISGLVLREITEEGVIFGFRDYLVAISVLAQWEDES